MLSADEFAAMYQSSWRTLWCVAVSVCNDKSLAEDALQESAIIGLRKRGEFTPGTGFVPWMSTIVRYVALNQSRKASRRPSVSVDPVVIDRVSEAAVVSITGPESEMFDDRVILALEKLPDTARQCLLLRTLFDTPYSEIAHRLEIPVGTAMSHVHRARRALRDQLGSDTSRDDRTSKAGTP